MTKRKALVLLFLLACIVVAGLVVTTSKPPEPTYNGRSLSEWLNATRFDIKDDQRIEAVRKIGTNALPFLVDWIQYEPSDLEFKLYGWFSSSELNPINRKIGRREEAIKGFVVLGQDAKPAIPELALLVDSTNSNTQMLAVDALGSIGREALPTLVDAVTNSLAHTNCDRLDVAVAFLRLKTNAFLAKPVMLAHIRDPNPQVASAATTVLAMLRVVQEQMALPSDSTADIVPALCANLDNTNTLVLRYTMRALSHFHPDARPAVPLLLRYLTSTNELVRAEARTALKQIDPQALKRAQKP